MATRGELPALLTPRSKATCIAESSAITCDAHQHDSGHEESASQSSAFRLITAPHEHVTQTRSPSKPRLDHRGVCW